MNTERISNIAARRECTHFTTNFDLHFRKWKGGDLGHKDAAYKRALQNSWIYTAIHFKANELAAGRLYVSHNETGMQDDSVPVKNHPLARILRKPNPLMGRGFLWQYSQWWLDLSGNAYWFLAPDEDNNLAEIYPLPANAVNPFPGDRERLTDYYEYTVNGRKWDIPAEYICHFRYPNPYDYFRGLSPLVAALLPSDADSAMAHWNGAFFGSGNVMPSAIINVSSGVPGTADSIDPQDMEAIKDALTSGDYAASARRTVVTNAYEMAVNILGWNAKDMDFLQGRMFTKDEILNIMGIPPGLLDKNATEANATTGDNVFKEKTLWPLMSTIYAETITSQILERWYSVGEEAAFEDIRPINKMQLLQEAQASTADMTRKERRARFWNLPPLGDERDDEIPGAGPAAAPADPSGMGTPGAGAGIAGGFPLPNMRNAAPEAVRALSPDALSDLRRWKNVMLKSYRENTEPKLDFVSDHIPFDVRTQVLNGLVHAETPEHVKSIFAQWMPGEASTKASPFPVGKPSNTRDDPYMHVKRMTEAELEQVLKEYFEGLAVRIGEQVDAPDSTKAFSSEGELKHPGHANQSVHGRKGGSSIPDDATDLQIYTHFSDRYGVKVMGSTGLTIEKAQHIDELLSRLPDKFTKDNFAFTELEVLSNNNPTDSRVNGFHQGKKITLYEQGSNLNNPGEWTKSNAFDETLYHEIGESVFKMISDKDQERWAKHSEKLGEPDFQAQDPNERFAIAFSRYWVGDSIPLEIESWVK